MVGKGINGTRLTKKGLTRSYREATAHLQMTWVGEWAKDIDIVEDGDGDGRGPCRAV